MSLPKSLLAYRDCFETLDRALADAKGVRLKVDDYNTALRIRTRIHYARTLDRLKNADVYEPGHAMHNCSQYDGLVVQIRQVEGEDGFWLFVKKVEFEYTLEPLSELEEEAAPDVGD